MIKISFISIAAVFCCNAFSQGYDNNWIFGDSTGLSFSTSPPSYINSGITGYEANASISDADGNLLFYTNGQNVWNREHEIMPNGDSLEIGKLFIASDNDSYSSSITQGTIIVPKPDSHQYIIFYIQSINVIDSNIYGLEYALVNMDSEGAMGNVTEKNIKIYNGHLSEKMQAVKHGNGRDWWLLVRTMKESDFDTQYFLRFLITPFGIDGPFFQEYGSEDLYGAGEMTFSQDGSLLAYTLHDDLYLYQFDRCSGELNEFTSINFEDHYLNGCTFSPNGTKIYVSEFCGKNLYQYGIEDGSLIDSTKKIVYNGPTSSFCQGQIELAHDGKIYLATVSDEAFSNDYNMRNQNLSVINFPDEVYPLCDFDTNTISLGDKRVLFGLPNMPNYNLDALIGSGCDTITAINNIVPAKDIEIYPNPANTFINISSHLTNYQNTIASIYTIAGTKVKEVKLIRPMQKTDITDLQEGLYTVVIRNDNNYLYSDKLVIIK